MAKKGKRDKRRQRGSGAEEAGPQAASAASGAATEPITPSAARTAAPAMPVATSASSGMPRALANGLILAFLVFQIAMPLRYYLGGRGYDERFSWRMFSTLRMQRCRVKVMETVGGTEQKLNIQKELQIAWNGMLERYRRPVVDKLLARRCVKAKASHVVFTRSCTDTDGSTLPDDVVSLDCKSGELVATASAPPKEAPPDDAAPDDAPQGAPQRSEEAP